MEIWFLDLFFTDRQANAWRSASFLDVVEVDLAAEEVVDLDDLGRGGVWKGECVADDEGSFWELFF